MILLNPGPANTTDSVKSAMTRPDVCPREPEFGDLLLSIRDRLTRVVHGEDRYTTVMLGGSGTAAVEAAIATTVPADGRLLVVDNGAYGRRMADIARAYALPHDVVEFPVGVTPDVERIAQQLAAVPYSHLSVVHHETSTGMLNPVPQIGRLCRRYEVDLIVDAMSSYAGIPIDVEALNIDYLVASSNKCIQGMAGLAFVVCSRAKLDLLKPPPGRSYYLNLASQHRFLDTTGQMQFTPPVQVVFALDQALTELDDEGGVPARHQRYLNNWVTMDTGMRGLGFRRLLPDDVQSHILTSYVEPDHECYSFTEMHDRLYGKGFTIYPGKGAQRETFRLANMGAIGPADLRAFVAAATEAVAEMGLKPLYSS